jgi:hypothetical protein
VLVLAPSRASRRQRPDRPSALRTEPYDIQNATAARSPITVRQAEPPWSRAVAFRGDKATSRLTLAGFMLTAAQQDRRASPVVSAVVTRLSSGEGRSSEGVNLASFVRPLSHLPARFSRDIRASFRFPPDGGTRSPCTLQRAERDRAKSRSNGEAAAPRPPHLALGLCLTRRGNRTAATGTGEPALLARAREGEASVSHFRQRATPVRRARTRLTT